MEVPVAEEQEVEIVIVDVTNERPMRENIGRSDFQQDYLELRRRGEPGWNFKSPKEYRECTEAWLSLPPRHKEAYLTRGHWDFEEPNEVQLRGEPDLWNAVKVINTGAALKWVGDPAANEVELMVPLIPQVPLVDLPVAVANNNDGDENENGEAHHQQQQQEDDDEEIQVLAIFPLRRPPIPASDHADIDEPRVMGYVKMELDGPMKKKPPQQRAPRKRKLPVASSSKSVVINDDESNAADIAPPPTAPISSLVDDVLPVVAVMKGQQGMDIGGDGDGILVEPVEDMEQRRRDQISVDSPPFICEAVPEEGHNEDAALIIEEDVQEEAQSSDEEEFANVVIYVHPQQPQPQQPQPQQPQQPQLQQQEQAPAPLRRSKRSAVVRCRNALITRQGHRGRREIGKPKTPLCSYMFFCRQESKGIARALKLAGKLVGRKVLGQELGRVWKLLLPEERQQFTDMCETDKTRYHQEMEIYKRNRGEDRA